MKHFILPLLILGGVNAMAQQKGCPVGKVYLPHMATSSIVLTGGCYTPAERNRVLERYLRNMCEETAFYSRSKNRKYEERHTYSKKDGCVIQFFNDTLIHGKWLPLKHKKT